MIRINLTPRKKRGGRGATAVYQRPGGAQAWLVVIALVWVGLGAVEWWLLDLEEQAEQQLRVEIAATNQQVEAIKKEIDEKGLEERETQVKQMEIAINKLNAKRRTPVYVMYEMAMILTDAQEGGGPDIDQEKYRRQLRNDPQSEINERWDPTGLWVTSLKESGGALTIEGEARDAADLTEFTRRLRSSARFGDLSNPDFKRSGSPNDDARYLTWTLSVQVQRWD